VPVGDKNIEMLKICGVCQSAIVEVKQDSWEYNSKKSSQVKTIGINYLGDGIESKFKIKQTSVILAILKRQDLCLKNDFIWFHG